MFDVCCEGNADVNIMGAYQYKLALRRKLSLGVQNGSWPLERHRSSIASGIAGGLVYSGCKVLGGFHSSRNKQYAMTKRKLEGAHKAEEYTI